MSLIHAANPETLLEGDLDFYPDAIQNPDSLLARLLAELPWQSDTLVVYGKEHVIPRLQCWIGDDGLDYRYSGKRFRPLPWHPLLRQLQQDLQQQLGLGFNSVLCNLYRNGDDGMGWHADDEPELGPAPVIASITLGACRDFALRRVGTTRQWGKLPLNHGSLLIMNAGMQQRWQHAVPKRAGIHQPRINLTYRWLRAAE